MAASDERDFAADGVQVQLSGPTSASATTDASGNVRLPDLLPGDYELTAKKPDFDDTLLAFTVEAGGATDVALVMLRPLDWSRAAFDMTVQEEADPDAPPGPDIVASFADHESDLGTPGGMNV